MTTIYSFTQNGNVFLTDERPYYDPLEQVFVSTGRVVGRSTFLHDETAAVWSASWRSFGGSNSVVHAHDGRMLTEAEAVQWLLRSTR